MLSRLVLSACFLASLTACSADYSANTYQAAAVQQANKVERGVIIGRRPVEVSAQGAVGAVTGGAAGGIAGSQAPGGSVGSAFGALGGTLVGGLVGTAAEHAAGDIKAWEYIVRQPNGDLVSVTQTDAVPLPIGLAVLVITGKQARVVADYTTPIAAAPPPAAETPVKPGRPSVAAPAPIPTAPLPPLAAAPSNTLPALP
ncbi:MAG TPA: hypothetical protein VFW75_13520 [Acetobacteraceae bacterium]|nr:hypothetical protein [Acetobacteraceae bacterium]